MSTNYSRRLHALRGVSSVDVGWLSHSSSQTFQSITTEPPQTRISSLKPHIMPPRLKALRLSASLLCQSHAPSKTPLIAPVLLPTQQRFASILSSLSDNKGAYSKKIRRGRGPASGKGKTAGRGQKGQHAHGKVPAGFEGGQTPLSITTPVRGRNKYNP